MFSAMFKVLLVASLLGSFAIATKQPTPPENFVSQKDVDSALAAISGIKFSQPSPNAKSTSEKRAKDRFQYTDNWTPIHSYNGPKSGQLSVAATLGQLQRIHGGHGYENITSTSAYGLSYGVEVSFNKQKLVLTLDTGSSDTWAVSAKSNCTNWWGSCSFGPAYHGGFLAGPLEDEHLYIEYGDGEIVQGPLGQLDVSVAGLHVKNQTVALANTTLWVGNNITSGILGLAYPSLTNAYEGSFDDNEPYYEKQYSPVFANMVDQGLVENYFSLAISRNTDDGVIAFGGVPRHLEGLDYDTKAMTDILIVNVANDAYAVDDYSFYTIIPQGWLFGTSSDDRKAPYIIDSGTSLVYIPTDIAQSINSAFIPPAEYDFLMGGYLTTCDAVPPRVAIVIDDQPFWLNPKDLMIRESADPLSGMCMTTIADGGSGPYILGDVFLKNVLAIFDVDDAVMQFAGRKNY